MILRLAKLITMREESANVIRNWEACMICGLLKERIVVSWSPLSLSILKFDADAAKGKPYPAG